MHSSQLSTEYSSRQKTFINPILRGGYPDPSICRVGDDFYLVNSSFEYFPGLPLHHSTDLVNWQLVGYGLHRVEQCQGVINLVDVQSSGGIHAPSIRFHKDTFYIITTNVYQPKAVDRPTKFINFIITSKNIQGPWSEPYILEGAPGIDPDIFFDEDGKVWYVGTHLPERADFEGQGEIWLQEIDLESWGLIGERYYLWRGACGGLWVEGPHIYKRDGRYYMVVAEGGTSYNHAVMIAVSDEINGPYISNPRNPILSSRHLSYDHWVHSTGHADMVELLDGRWYMVALGIRGDEQRQSNMGRETHLIPVIWEREPYEWKGIKLEWPVCAPITGRVERINPLPFENTKQYRDDSFIDNFESEILALEWNFRRLPMSDSISLSAREGYLRLYPKAEIMKERSRFCFLGIRQKESDFEFSVRMEFQPEIENTEAGISLFQGDDNYINYTALVQDGKIVLKLVLAVPQKLPVVLEQEVLVDYHGEIIFKIISKNHRYHYAYSLDNAESFQSLAKTSANHILSHGYTGAYMGLYATGNGKSTKAYADFDWVRYQGHPRV